MTKRNSRYSLSVTLKDTMPTNSDELTRETLAALAAALDATGLTPKEFRKEIALGLYQQHRLSFGKARESAGISAWDFQALLGQRGVPVHYDLADLEAELVAWAEHAWERRW